MYVGITETPGEIRFPHSSGFYVDLAVDRMSSGKHRQSSRPSGLIILVPVHIPSLALKELKLPLGDETWILSSLKYDHRIKSGKMPTWLAVSG